MIFIETLTALINEKGISKAKMLKDLNLGQGTFATWEKRGTIPSGDILTKLANYFNVSTDFLLGNTNVKEKPIFNPEDELAAKLYNQIKDYPEEVLKQVLEYAKFLNKDLPKQ